LGEKKKTAEASLEPSMAGALARYNAEGVDAGSSGVVGNYNAPATVEKGIA
jgi:hypothetical protein